MDEFEGHAHSCVVSMTNVFPFKLSGSLQTTKSEINNRPELLRLKYSSLLQASMRETKLPDKSEKGDTVGGLSINKTRVFYSKCESYLIRRKQANK